LRARLHLLLRAADARILRPLRRARLRVEDPREGTGARDAPPRAVRAAVEAAGPRHERRDGPVPADRTAPPALEALPRGPARVPQPGRDHHEEPPGRTRRRSPRRAGEP